MTRTRPRNYSASGRRSISCGGYCWEVDEFQKRFSSEGTLGSELFNALDEKWYA